MWARWTELGCALWLVASPWIFDHDPAATSLWIMDFAAGVLLVASTALNYSYPSQRIYLGVPALGALLIAAALLSGPHPIAPGRQNHIMVGLTLMMLGIVPNRALRPPDEWRSFHRER